MILLLLAPILGSKSFQWIWNVQFHLLIQKAGTIPVKSRQAFPFYSEVARVLKLNFNCFFSQKQGKLLWWWRWRSSLRKKTIERIPFDAEIHFQIDWQLTTTFREKIKRLENARKDQEGNFIWLSCIRLNKIFWIGSFRWEIKYFEVEPTHPFLSNCKSWTDFWSKSERVAAWQRLCGAPLDTES